MSKEPVPRIEAISSVRQALAPVERPIRPDPKPAEPANMSAEKAGGPGSEKVKPAVSLPGQTYAQFIVDDHFGMARVKIIDAETNEVLREFPPEALAKLAEDAKAYQKLGSSRGK